MQAVTMITTYVSILSFTLYCSRARVYIEYALNTT